MKRIVRQFLLGLTLALLAGAAVVYVPAAGGQTAPATATAPATTAASAPSKPKINAAGEVVLTFERGDAGKAIPTWKEGDVTFSLAWAPRNSRAQGRIVFFPHLKTERQGILNAMANEQAIPVKAEIPGGASSVTLVMWGTIGGKARVEAHDKDGKLLDVAELPGTVPERKSPADPIPSFELSVKGDKIAYVLFGGAVNGGAVAVDEMRYKPIK